MASGVTPAESHPSVWTLTLASGAAGMADRDLDLDRDRDRLPVRSHTTEPGSRAMRDRADAGITDQLS